MVTLFLYAVTEDCTETQSLFDVEPLSWTGQRLCMREDTSPQNEQPADLAVLFRTGVCSFSLWVACS